MAEWRWYCRICGVEGTHGEDEAARTEAAIDHVRSDHPMAGRVVVGSSSGRLLHVWPVPAELGPPSSGGVLWPLDPPGSDDRRAET